MRSVYRVEKFDGWIIDIGTNTIRKDKLEIELSPKAMDVLTLLWSRVNTTVKVEEILSECWPNTIVGINSVYQAMSEIRRAFGHEQDAKSPVVTIPKRGYRLTTTSRSSTSVSEQRR